MNNADSFGLFASGIRVIQGGGTISPNGSVKGYKKPPKPVPSEQEEEDVKLMEASFTGSDESDLSDVTELWSSAFNLTMFPETTNLTEKQKNVVVNALLGNFHHD